MALAGVFLAAGCGSGSSAHSSHAGGTLKALSEAPGLKTVALTPGDADFSPGPLRYSFLVVDNNGKAIEKPTARVWIARGFEEKPFASATAHLETIGLPTRLDIAASGEALVAHMRHDKKARGGRLPFILARGIGQAFVDRDVDLVEVAAFLDRQRA